jgi:hypothetical protein
MQIHRIPVHDRGFVILANQAVQDRRLSHTARGILALVLSLPDGVQENVRTLSDRYPDGRNAVAKAITELRRLGYWVTSTRRDPESGRILSSVDVYEVPGGEAAPAAATTAVAATASSSAVSSAGAVTAAVSAAAAPRATTVAALGSLPVPTRPGPGGRAPGGPAAGAAGASPCGQKEQDKNGEKPSLVPWRRGARESGVGGEGGVGGTGGTGGTSGTGGTGWTGEAGQSSRETEAARILRRLEAVDARLRLREREVRELAPAVGRWLARGATVGEVTDALTQGLPSRLYSARHLLADRLERKLPPAKRRWRTYAECGTKGCGSVLPAGQETGICSGCALGTGSGVRADSVTHFIIDCATGAVKDALARGLATDPAPSPPARVPAPAVVTPALVTPASAVTVAAPAVEDAAAGGARPSPVPAPVLDPVPDPARKVRELRALLRGRPAAAVP